MSISWKYYVDECFWSCNKEALELHLAVHIFDGILICLVASWSLFHVGEPLANTCLSISNTATSSNNDGCQNV